MHTRKGFFGRFADLWRGMFGVRMTRAEVKHAEAVYHQAIVEQKRHYDELRNAASRLVYLRNRVQTDLDKNKSDLEVVETALRKAALADDDQRALALLQKQRELTEAIGRGEGEIVTLNQQAEAAKESLVKLSRSLEELKRERHEMMARKAHAEAQIAAQSAVDQALNKSSLGANQALENVREAIAQLEGDAGLMGAHPTLPGEVSMNDLRKEAREESDRQALGALKMQLRGKLLAEGKGGNSMLPNSSTSGVVS